METTLSHFENLSAGAKLGFVFVALLMSWVLEFLFPLRQLSYRKWHHARVNLTFFVFSLVINLVVGLAAAALCQFVTTRQLGLIHLIDWPLGAELFLTLILFDLVAQYAVHYLLHQQRWLWRLHMIHHSDRQVDATTGTRHHPLDYFLREVAGLLVIAVAGVPMAFYMVYRVITIFFTYLTHANWRMPSVLDRAFSLVFVTPNMHKFHHHDEAPWTDSNYGGVLSIWDRLFGTLVYGPTQKISYGLDVLRKYPDDQVLFQLKLPFDPKIKSTRSSGAFRSERELI